MNPTLRTAAATLAAFLLFAYDMRAGETERFLLYKVERIAKGEAPVLDGKLDDAAWRDKAVMASLRNFHGPRAGEFASQPTRFTLLTDGRTLYIGMTFEEEAMEDLRFDPSKQVYWNDCTEIYFDPLHDGTEHIQLVVDCGGRRWWHKRFDKGYGWWDDSAWYMFATWNAAVHRGKNAWTLEIAIDCPSFNIDTTPGNVVGANLCRFRLGPDPTEFSAWGFDPARGRQKAMHAWGHLLFLPEGETAKGAEVTRKDVLRVYPDLGERRIQVPAEDGFVIVSANDVETVSFRDHLAGMAAPVATDLEKTQAAIAALSGKMKDRYSKRLDKIAPKIRNLLASAKKEDVTLGACDRIVRELGKIETRLDNLYWEARIARLVASE